MRRTHYTKTMTKRHLIRECRKMAARYVSTKDQLEKLQLEQEELLSSMQATQNTMRLFSEALKNEVEKYG